MAKLPSFSYPKCVSQNRISVVVITKKHFERANIHCTWLEGRETIYQSVKQFSSKFYKLFFVSYPIYPENFMNMNTRS